MKKNFVFSVMAFFLFSAFANGETLYVTDRILLGLHQEASEISPVIKTITSGTKATVLQRNESFVKIKIEDGTEGWVSKNYLKKERPARAELDETYARLQNAQQSNKKLVDELATKEREIQVRRDELSNAKSSIKDLKSALKDAGRTVVPAKDPAALNKANEKIKSLEEKITQFTQEKDKAAAHSGDSAAIELEKAQIMNKEFQVRIEAALANLSGETVPSAAELAAIRPSFPFWYWLLLFALLLTGVAAGVIGMDILHRRKHGGFRL